MNKITVTLYLERSDHELIKAAADQVDRSVSNYCRHVLTLHARTIQDKQSDQDQERPQFIQPTIL